MNNYFWIPHIHSEVAGIGSILNPGLLSLVREKIMEIADVADVVLTNDVNETGNCATFYVITGLSGNVCESTMTVYDDGFCCIQTLSNDVNLKMQNAICTMISVANCYLGNTIHYGDDSVGENSVDYSWNFGPVSADNSHEAIMRIVDTILRTCQYRMDYITNTTDDQSNIFIHLGGVMECLSFVESFIESVKDHIPQEYEGLMRTLERYRRCIDNRSSMIRIESDIRRERGQQELNAHTLSINRGVYYLSVLGIGVSMFGASIVADSLISISPLMKAGLISVASISVLTACWWISKRMMGKIRRKGTLNPGCYTDRTVTP